MNINTTDCEWTALRFATHAGDLEAAKFLLSRGADVEAPTKSGETALILAIESVKPRMVELLLAKGANVYAKKSDDVSVLQFADRLRHVHSVPSDTPEREAIYAMVKARVGGL